MNEADVGVISLDEAGRSFASNLERAGYRVAVHDPRAVCQDPGILFNRLKPPRKIVIRTDDVDPLLEAWKSHLHEEDLLLDLSDSFFLDTERRARDMGSRGFYFLGVGRGPGLMVGGNPIAYHSIKPLLDAAAGRAGFVGARGAGHYAGMVWNAVEHSMAGEAQALGPGRWVIKVAEDLGISIPTLELALRGHRLEGPASCLCACAQGMDLLHAAFEAYNYLFHPAEVIGLWKGSITVPPDLLEEILSAYEENEDLRHLFHAPSIASHLASLLPAWRRALSPVASASLDYCLDIIENRGEGRG